MELRQRLKQDPALNGTKLTYMPFFLKVPQPEALPSSQICASRSIRSAAPRCLLPSEM